MLGNCEAEGREVAQAVTLFAEDTVLSALGLMQRHGLSRLPVVDDERGELLGEVTEGELRRLWKVAPLLCMSEVLTARAALWNDEGEGSSWRPKIVLVSPLQEVFKAHRWKQ